MPVIDRQVGGRNGSAGAASVAPPPVSRPAAPPSRLAYLDNLKVTLAVAVIAVHAANFYYGASRWPPRRSGVRLPRW